LAVVPAVLTPKHLVRELFAACVLICIGNVASADVQVLNSAVASPTPAAITSGALDDQFTAPASTALRSHGGIYWLRIHAAEPFPQAGIPALVMHAGRQTRAEVFAVREGRVMTMPLAAQLPEFRGTRNSLFTLVEGLTPGQSLYVRLNVAAGESEPVSFANSTLERALQGGVEHARMIALTVGALMAVAITALLIWFVLAERLFILYATLFFLQALYMTYLSGQGFDWPWFSHAERFGSFAWNVPAGLCGAVACLFTREIADLRHFSPRIYEIFGWFAAAFVLVTIANLAKLLGLGMWVTSIGNLMFVALTVFTTVVAFLAWRRGNRAAGWFMVAWALLEGFTMTAAVRFLITGSVDANPALYYYGLPLSMVAAAVLIALGVADRLRAQRLALTDAERRAQTDPLTGVLNRRSLIERLDAACLRARARGLPIALLFIDLDHFKQINDSYGHQAGDACLRAIIDPIHAELRQSDVIGRYGGEEFVVILSSADAAAASPIAQRILQGVADVRVDGLGQPIRLTCSIGIAASDTLGVWGEHLIARADAAVYVAKRLGRNQVQMAAPLAA
jgi:diguanylate cyclase (GGDEF)-like protein